MYRVVVSLLFLLHSSSRLAAAAALPNPGRLPRLDDGLTYVVFTPSRAEWEATFGTPAGHGPVHLWLRCRGGLLRGYAFNDERDGVAGEDFEMPGFNSLRRVATRDRFHLLVGGAPPSVEAPPPEEWAGTHFVAAVGPGAQANASSPASTHAGAAYPATARVSVAGWAGYADVPLAGCWREPAAPPKRRGPRPVLVSVYLYEVCHPCCFQRRPVGGV